MGIFEGKSIPNLLKNEAYEAVWENHESPDLKKLYDYRITRTRLHRDDKILVSWNGWMICACAKAGAVLDDTNYLDMAARAETFIHENLVRDGRLMVRYREGDSAGRKAGRLCLLYSCPAGALQGDISDRLSHAGSPMGGNHGTAVF